MVRINERSAALVTGGTEMERSPHRWSRRPTRPHPFETPWRLLLFAFAILGSLPTRSAQGHPDED